MAMCVGAEGGIAVVWNFTSSVASGTVARFSAFQQGWNTALYSP